MDILSELRRAGHHLVAVAFMLALYCGLIGADAAGTALASIGVAALVGLAAIGSAQPGSRLDIGDADETEYPEFDDLWPESQS